MHGIVKDFPGLRAVDHVDLQVEEGEIHALLGENGAGKTTLMNILYGLYRADEGQIFWNDEPVDVSCPSEAVRLGIGMVHQHFMLVQKMTALENILLGMRPEGYPIIRRQEQLQQAEILCQKYGLKVNLRQRVDTLSVGEQQRVEILKALFRDAKVLVLDEPTSVLTPQETQEFFQILRVLRDEGHSIILIAHNLSEILSISDRVSVLRDGKKVCTIKTSSTNERELSRYMIGRDFLASNFYREATDQSREILRFQNISLHNSEGVSLLRDVCLCVHSGEILGIAGIDGNGQTELAEVLMGIRRQSGGDILLDGQSLGRWSVRRRWEAGLAYIPADRHQDGLIMDADVKDNTALRTYYQPPLSRTHILQPSQMRDQAAALTEDYQVKTPSVATQVRLLSGGNQQKLILARELQSKGNLLVACQPTRGLDIGAAEYLHTRLMDRRNQGRSVLLISTDLGEILALSDRIAVICSGKIMGVVPNTPDLSAELLGLMMGGSTLEEAKGWM